jgi:tRNA-2-methylthio-N6-dimethylallyladenosine synthase
VKRVYIKTYGCQMNVRDSEAVAALLRARGYVLTGSEQDADVILLNTCSVRDMAEQKAIGKMGMLTRLKKRRPDLVLGYLGCMAQSRGATLAEQQPAVDLVVGTQRFHHVADYIDALLRERERAAQACDAALTAIARAPIVDIAEEPGSESAVREHLLGENGERPVTAFVSIQQGCDMHCAFCIVPHTRGAERSRSIAEIVEETRQLVARGAREVTLLGQIVTSYGRKRLPKRDGKSPFVQLLEAVHEIEGLDRIRFTSPHPKGFGDDLVAAYRELPKLCEHAHLPAQSGSDRVLKRMKRGYTRDWYLRVVEKLRRARPGMAISTDIIVGFPGETEEDFQQTAALMRDAEFDQAYIFRYSPRRDTPAAEMAGQLPERIKHERNQALLEIINETAVRINRRLVGATVEILVEGRSPRNPRRMMGRTRGNKIVVFDGGERHRGELLAVRIQRATPVTLYGDAAIHGLRDAVCGP